MYHSANNIRSFIAQTFPVLGFIRDTRIALLVKCRMEIYILFLSSFLNSPLIRIDKAAALQRSDITKSAMFGITQL